METENKDIQLSLQEFLRNSLKVHYKEQTSLDEIVNNIFYELVYIDYSICVRESFDLCFDEAFALCNKLGFDKMQIFKKQKNEPDSPPFVIFNVPLIYSFILSFYKKSENLSGIKIVGELHFNNLETPLINVGKVDDGFAYINEIAFRYFKNLVCYVPDYADEGNPEYWFTREEIIEFYGNDYEKGLNLLLTLTGEHPETLINSWKNHTK